MTPTSSVRTRTMGQSHQGEFHPPRLSSRTPRTQQPPRRQSDDSFSSRLCSACLVKHRAEALVKATPCICNALGTCHTVRAHVGSLRGGGSSGFPMAGTASTPTTTTPPTATTPPTTTSDPNALPTPEAMKATCASMVGKTFASATVTAANRIEGDATLGTSGMCQVLATRAPYLDIEVVVPDNWSGRYYQQGGGGFDGTIRIGLHQKQCRRNHRSHLRRDSPSSRLRGVKRWQSQQSRWAGRASGLL